MADTGGKNVIIKLDNVVKYYDDNQVVKNLNLNIYEGEFLTLLGPSGCGKSTLLNIMGLLDAPSSGKIEINGTSVENMKDKEYKTF